MISKEFTFLVFFVAAGILISGCSASTSSSRFGDKNINTESAKTTSRYPSDKDIAGSTVPDTSSSNDYYFDEEEFDEEPIEELTIDYSEVLRRLSQPTDNLNADLGNRQEKIVMEIIKYLNTPYKYGGNTKNGIDCSAFTKTVFGNGLSVTLQRTARDQFTQGIVVSDRTELVFGDLVFFNTRRRVRPGHVGIYLGDNLFAHASTKLGVTISSLEENYYHQRYMGGRRLDD